METSIMKTSAVHFVENYLGFYLSKMEEILEGDDNGRKLIVCALLGFQPQNPLSKKYALWWQTVPDDDLEEGFLDLMYGAYETDDDDGFTWALMHYMLIGLYNFRFQHDCELKTDAIKEAYEDMSTSFFWGINNTTNPETYKFTMRVLDKVVRKMGRRRLKRTFRRRQCAYKR